MIYDKRKKLDEFEIEAKTSGGAVFELGVKTSKHSKAIRRIAKLNEKTLER